MATQTTITQHWSNRNSTRAYPFVETCSMLDAKSRKLPHDWLAEIQIQVPAVLDIVIDSVSLGSMTVTPNSVSLSLLGTNAEGATTLVAHVCEPRPVLPGRPFALVPMHPGVSGWLSFGPGVDQVKETTSYNFTDPTEAVLLPTVTNIVQAGTLIDGIRAQNCASLLQGEVTLLGQDDMEIVEAHLDLDGTGELQRCILFQLTDRDDPSVLKSYVGKCGKTPESGTCDVIPISVINNITPDAAGNLRISIDPMFAIREACDGILLVDCAVSQTEACENLNRNLRPGEDGSLPNESSDECPDTGPVEDPPV